MQKSSSKRAPGQDLAQNCRFQTFPKEVLIRTWRAAKMPKIELQKGSWPGFCPKGHFPMISRRTFFIVTWKPPKGSWSGFDSNWLFPCIPTKGSWRGLGLKWLFPGIPMICLSPHPIECLVVSSSALGTTLKHTKVLSA